MSYEKEQFSIMNDLMGALTQTDVFCRTFTDDPMIKEAERHADQIVKGLALPHELEDTLRSSISLQTSAYMDAAILCGLRVADAIRFSSTHADAFSAYIMARIRDQES